MSVIAEQAARRRAFAIISHPDAGKPTLTEKLLLYGGAIHLAGSVKARRARRHATSDWMELEKERGISVTSSVLQFEYRRHAVPDARAGAGAGHPRLPDELADRHGPGLPRRVRPEQAGGARLLGREPR